MYSVIDPEENPYDSDVEDEWDNTDDLIVELLTLHVTFDKSLDIPMKYQKKSEYQLKALSFLQRHTNSNCELARTYKAEDYPHRDSLCVARNLFNTGKYNVG